ncbi:hypothetical protein ACHAXA_003234 [Cyclostephanos tholiformis]|uniref:E3 ubiquitin-protein ligase listerin n=1 Tax=Cyclostephanos tholiformis TaxID=382380 RepID=A0ABD3R9B9_9STRA
MSNHPPPPPGSSASSFRGFAMYADPSNISDSTTAAATLAARRAAARAGTTRRPPRASAATGDDDSIARDRRSSRPRQHAPRTGPRPSPVYAGYDARLIGLFRKIGRKSDPTTRVRGLEGLVGGVFNANERPRMPTSSSGQDDDGGRAHDDGDGDDDTGDDDPPRGKVGGGLGVEVGAGGVGVGGDGDDEYPRSEKIAALCHLIHLHETRLGYDDDPAVRAASYMALNAARDVVPGAWGRLFAPPSPPPRGMEDDDDFDNDHDRGGGDCERTVGMAWGAYCGDTSSDVMRKAGEFVNSLLSLCASSSSSIGGEGGEESKNDDGFDGDGDGAAPTSSSAVAASALIPGGTFVASVCRYSVAVLACRRPSALGDYVDRRSFSSSGPVAAMAGAKIAGGKKKDATATNDAARGDGGARDRAGSGANNKWEEERYERVILSTLLGLGRLFELIRPDKDNGHDDHGGVAALASFLPDLAPSLIRLLSSSRISFRRGVYVLLCRACRHYVRSSSSSSMPLGKLIPDLLASEREPTNFASLLEMVLSFIAAAAEEKKNAATAANGYDEHDNDGPWNRVVSGQDGALVVGGDKGRNNNIDPSAFVKSLCRALRKGCHGAPACDWAPVILPIVALLPTNAPVAADLDGGEGGKNGESNGTVREERPYSISVVLSLWEGRKFAAGTVDAIAIVSATAECATFLMLRRGKRNNNRIREGHSGSVATTRSWRECGGLFLDSLTYFLTDAPPSIRSYGPVASAVDGLSVTLARDLNKLDVASSSYGVGADGDNDDDRGVTAVKSWLWGEEGLMRCAAALSLEEGRSKSVNIVQKWDALLRRLITSSSNINGEQQYLSNAQSNMTPACKRLFHTILESLSLPDRTDKSCNEDEGRLILTIFHFCSVNNIFAITAPQSCSEDGGKESCTKVSYSSIEHFCVNDLLKWILVHASTSSSSIEIDFDVLNLCLNAIPSTMRQKKIWEAILRELIKSYCDYTTLSVGLGTLVKLGGACDVNKTRADFVKCEMLDAFAINAADQVIDAFRRSHDILRQHDESDGEDELPVTRQGDVLRFLKTCVGISRDNPSGGVPIVSTSVIRYWIHLCCQRSSTRKTLEDGIVLEDESGDNVLLNTLLDLAFSSSLRSMNTISPEDTVNLVYESMFEGGKIWHECMAKYFTLESTATATLRDRVISIASSSLYEDIHSKPPSDNAVLELFCHAWANRAARLFAIHPGADLTSIGLDRIELWDKAAVSDESNASDFLFLSLMYFLHSFDCCETRREIVFKYSGAELFACIQTCISKCNAQHVETFHRRTSRNHDLVEALGGPSALSVTILEDSCVHTIDLLHAMMTGEMPGGNIPINRALTSLSFLMTVLFPSEGHIRDSNKDADIDVIASHVKEGDSMWYERGELRERVKATVLKIHTDDFPHLYFTIKEEGSNQERQTVANRLKWNLTNDNASYNISAERVGLDNDNNGDTARREKIGRQIMDKLIQPSLSEAELSDDDNAILRSEISAESVNIVVSQCGVVSLGIGSVRYDIFQAVSSIKRNLCVALSCSDPNLSKATLLLRYLSLAMGYSFQSMPSRKNITILKLDLCRSAQCLFELYENVAWLEAQTQYPLKSFHTGVVMWLAVALGAMKEGEMLRRVASIIRSISDILLGSDECESDSLHVMNAMRSLREASDCCIDYSIVDSDDEKSVLSKLTRSFVNLIAVNSCAPWIEGFAHLIRHSHKKSPCILVPAATLFSDELCDCFFDRAKRWCAYQLMHLFAKDSHPLQTGENVIIPPTSEQQLTVWKARLDEEEAIELEGDLLVTASWFPGHIMSVLQNVGNNSTSIVSDLDPQSIAMGNLLAWLVSLDILDVAGSLDMRNRSHIISFIQKTGSLGCIMNSALHQAQLDVSRSDNIFACVDLDCMDDFFIQKISTLVIFRTVESLPTLVKTWYNDDCPRFLRQKLGFFVENTVAPATLQRELVRIKDIASFGEMTISGSCVSREVVATYQQDECQLSVMIRMPSTFPLRNVEVDCQKTMGIPEKRWRRWAVQIMLMLNNQDGSILDALLLWKQNVDKEFEGVEPCPVCYSVLCIKTHQMPNLECKTCHNRFHTTCLMQWFKSSGKSQCVLCQQPWSGSKV